MIIINMVLRMIVKKFIFLSNVFNRLTVTSVLYFLNRADISLTSHFFVATRLSLACLDRDICFYINVFFLYTYFLLT